MLLPVVPQSRLSKDVWAFQLILRHLLDVVLGGRNTLLVVFGLAVEGFLWGNFPVEGIFPLELTWVQTPFPQKLFRMRV